MNGVSHLQLNKSNLHLKSKYEDFSYYISRGDPFPLVSPCLLSLTLRRGWGWHRGDGSQGSLSNSAHLAVWTGAPWEQEFLTYFGFLIPLRIYWKA